MASIRNRNGKWQARIARKGEQPIAKSFQSKQNAECWARQIESDIDKGSYTNLVLADKTPFKDVIERYVLEVTLTTRGMKEDTFRLRALARHPIARLKMAAITPIKVAEYRDERLKVVSPATVIRELSYFWASNKRFNSSSERMRLRPCGVRGFLTKGMGLTILMPHSRLVWLMMDEKPRVKNANTWLLPLTMFALESAMRRGEILGLRWERINLEKRTAFIPLTKNGESRTVPLSLAWQKSFRISLNYLQYPVIEA